jgi:hypothetical protein
MYHDVFNIVCVILKPMTSLVFSLNLIQNNPVWVFKKESKAV